MNVGRYRTLIADDEPVGRGTIRALLQSEPDFEIVAETATGEETFTALRRERPDLLFLDIAMPLGDGLETLERLAPWERPVTVFVTAHGQFSLRAFDLHASDYLLKPFSDERFAAMLGHVRRLLAPAGSPSRSMDSKPAESPEWSIDDKAPRAAWLVVRTATATRLLPWDAIDWIEARGDYVRLHTEQQIYLIRENIGALERRADPARFVRVHRSTMVNLGRVKEFRIVSPTEQFAVMTGGAQCRISERGRERLADVLGQPL